ncbi:hypothetical protein ACFL0Q_00635 [Thermodesulfobacteriota bacterium]
MTISRFSESIPHLQKALDIARQFGDKRGIAAAVGYMAVSHSFTGDFDACVRESRESASLAREVGNQYLLVSTFHWLLLGFAGRGEYDDALKALDELSNGAREIGNKHLVAMVPNHYGWIYNELCNFERAAEYDKEGVGLTQRYEDPECEVFSLLNLVRAYIGLGDYARAQQYLDEVKYKRELKWYMVRRWRYDMHVTRYESMLSMIRGEHERALKYADETLAQGERTGAKKYIGIGCELKGEVLMGLERFDEALECLVKARDLGDQMGYPPLRWKTRYLLGQVHKAQGRIGQAKEELQNAAAVIEKMASKVSDKEVKETFLSSESVRDVYTELRAL